MAPHLTKPATPGNDSADTQLLVRRLTLEVRSLNICLEDFLQVRAKALGITGPQLTILMAVTDLTSEGDVAVSTVAKLLKVDPSFITINSKALEKAGFLRRKPCIRDGRVVHMSLTDKACKRLANVAAQQKELDQFVFGELGVEELTKLSSRFAALRRRLDGARLKAAMDIGAVTTRGRGRLQSKGKLVGSLMVALNARVPRTSRHRHHQAPIGSSHCNSASAFDERRSIRCSGPTIFCDNTVASAS